MRVPEFVKSVVTLTVAIAAILLAWGLAMLGLLVGVFVLASWCRHDEFYRYTSPDDRKDAVIFERSCGMRSAFLVAVVPKGEKKLHLDRSIHMARSRDFPTVRWRGAQELAVCGGPGRPHAESRTIDGISVVPGCD